MEEDPGRFFIESKLLQKPTIQKQLEQLKAAAEEADEILKYESAHNPELLYAIDIVEKFLKRRHRVCYGGTAINALLPKKLQFYDRGKDIPDYDFFTPAPEKDIREIVADLQKAGFQEVVERVGVHEGTHKILVNFVPIADITTLEPSIYKSVLDRSIEKDGIQYCDPDLLRMLMYLELSRPRGQVERWEKVYERLVLLNAAYPVKLCRISVEDMVGGVHLPLALRETLLNFVIDNQRVLVGAEVIAFYDWVLSKSNLRPMNAQWFIKKNGMMVFMSPEPVADAKQIEDMLQSPHVTLTSLRGSAEYLAKRVLLSYKGNPFLMIVGENACHAYQTIPLTNQKQLRVGSLETLITLYYSMTFFSEDEDLLKFPLLCLCQKLVDMAEALHRLGPKAPVPAFTIECSGYQKGFATLLREKFSRIARQKQKKSTTETRKKR